jgi:hypothetical protein
MKQVKANAAFFIDEQFVLSDEDREELKNVGLSFEAVGRIEGAIQELRALYVMPQLTRVERIELVRNLLKPLKATSHALAQLDDQTVGLLVAETLIPMREFSAAVEKFRVAAEVLGARHKARGQAADKGNHIAIDIAKALIEFDVEPDDKARGVFMSALRIALSNLGLTKADPRNEARRALNHLRRKRGKLAPQVCRKLPT